ncbi:MAG: (Fe-S)-binding protein [archaeon]|nr:(Fe-S)-binding protein [archaeon]
MCALPQFVVDIMASCVGCRRCEKVCPSHQHGGCSPWLSMIAKDPNTVSCIGCGKCSEVCRHTNPKRAMMYLKAEKLGLQVPDVFTRHGFVLPPASDEWREGLLEMKRGDDVYLIPGCIVNGKLPYLKYAAHRAFEVLGVGMSELPGNTCCMYPLPLRSMGECERDSYKYRMRANAKGRDMVTLCSGCTIELGLSAVHAPNICTYLSKYLDRIRALPGVDLRVAIEPGCASERYMSDFEAIVRATGATPIGNKYGCCGKAIEGINSKLMAERQAECQGADAIILGCPNCQVFYDNVPDGIPVLNLAELIALAAGDRETQRFHRLKLRE